mgnify:CR=1 FL=1
MITLDVLERLEDRTGTLLAIGDLYVGLMAEEVAQEQLPIGMTVVGTIGK